MLCYDYQRFAKKWDKHGREFLRLGTYLYSHTQLFFLAESLLVPEPPAETDQQDLLSVGGSTSISEYHNASNLGAGFVSKVFFQAANFPFEFPRHPRGIGFHILEFHIKLLKIA
jgi:hypothetical protein